MRASLGGLTLLAALTLLAGAVRAQSEPRLTAAMREAQDGQGDSARAVVKRMLAATPTTDSLYPQILYTAAMVSDDGSGMRRHLQRITVEFPASAWADDASLRLAQLDYAGRDLDAAGKDLERIHQDYPDTPLFAEASYWAARVYLDQNRQADACRWIAEGVKRADDQVELRAQLDDLNRRCGVIGAAPAAPARTDSTPLQPAKPMSVSAVPRFRIQIAAVGTERAARSAEGRAETAGFDAVTVKEQALFKVRVGSWAERRAAQEAVAGVKAKLGGSPYVVEER